MTKKTGDDLKRGSESVEGRNVSFEITVAPPNPCRKAFFEASVHFFLFCAFFWVWRNAVHRRTPKGAVIRRITMESRFRFGSATRGGSPQGVRGGHGGRRGHRQPVGAVDPGEVCRGPGGSNRQLICALPLADRMPVKVTITGQIQTHRRER